MKKRISLMFVTAAALTLVACNNEDSRGNNDDGFIATVRALINQQPEVGEPSAEFVARLIAPLPETTEPDPL